MVKRKSAPSRAARARASSTPANPNLSARSPVTKKPGKSIVNQKHTPWGLIWTTVVVVVFAAAVVAAVLVTNNSSDGAGSSTAGGQSVDPADPYRQPELAAAKTITGVAYRVEGQHKHVSGSVNYDSSPPAGGKHNGFSADCAGTAYAKPIANENAVHMLEHGAVWITYNPNTLPASGLAELKKYAAGIDRLALSPFPKLKTPISLQAWGYQLFLTSPADPRIAQFIATLKYNKKTTPEYGASCSNPGFKDHPSTFGHPTGS